MSESFGKALEVIKEDWAKLASLTKFCFLASVIIIAMMFALEPDTIVLHGKPYEFWLSILVACLVLLPLFYWSGVELKIRYYRWFRYPLRNIGKSFKFKRVDELDAVLIVYGSNLQKARWVENGRTMYDLGFEPYYRHVLEEIPLKKDSINKYQLKKGLRTRRKPGGLSKENS
jgi:hypothetical protein